MVPDQPTKDTGRTNGNSGSSPSPGKNHLLVIAVDQYQHCPPLQNCVKDAKDFISVLRDRYQFEDRYIITLFNEQASRAVIHTQLRALKKKVRPEDNLILYFSGHGETEDQIGYWVPADAHPDRDYEFISTAEIKNRLDTIPSFHTFLIVDACFSGALFTTYRSVKAGYENRRSRWGLAASHSRERALDGAPGENSPFARTLLQKLRENAESIGIHKLATEVIEDVQQITEGKQTPVFKPLNVKGDDSGQYVFHLRREPSEWEAAWQRIVNHPEGNLPDLQAKILQVEQYVEKYEEAQNIKEAYQLGELLEEKRAFFLAKGSLFRLKLFVKKDTPFKKEALALLTELKTEMDGSQPSSTSPGPSPPERIKTSSKPAPKSKRPSSPSGQSNSFTDPRDGQTYRTVTLKDGKRWMAENLNFDIGKGCWFYENDEKHGNKHGRLYSWSGAMRACPPGWRLPTDEEWQEMVRHYGGYYDVQKEEGRAAYHRLIKGGESQFSGLLSGRRGSGTTFYFLNSCGYYWSSTEMEKTYAWAYEFSDLNNILRMFYHKSWAFSCRCVKD